jgi:hypothetical protein
MTIEVNQRLNACLEGVPENVSLMVIEALALLSGKPQLMSELGEMPYQERMFRVREAYRALLFYLIDHYVGAMNPAQRLFVNTGAVADRVVFEDEQGERYEVELLAPEIYEALLDQVLAVDDNLLPRWTRNIYRAEDQYNAIALGVLEPEGLDKKNLAKFRATRSLEQQNMSREQATTLNNTYYALLQQSQELFTQLDNLFDSYTRHSQHLPEVKNTLLRVQRYNHMIAVRDPQPEERDEMTRVLNDPGHQRMGQDIELYAQEGLEILQAIQEQSQTIDLKNQKLKEISAKLIHSGAQDVGSVRHRQDIIFDEETRRLIKRHVQTTATFAVSAVQSLPQKMDEDTTQILLNAHFRRPDMPLTDILATVNGLQRSFQKIMGIHTNLFPRDAADEPILPPVLIEPIRRYLEWTGERFIVGLVTAETPRSGKAYNFSSLDMAVMKLCGMYAFKDKIFDYRGNRLEGNLMADYSARLSSKTTVKWVGEEKKYKLVTVMQEIDSASRSEAVEDYLEFVFHAANGFPAPLHLSKRKMAVLLRYVQIFDPVYTAALVLRYVADQEPEEARNVLVYRAGYDRARAFELVQHACDQHKDMLPETNRYYEGVMRR